MSILQIILMVIGNIPQIVGIITDIINLIGKLAPAHQDKAFSDLRNAYQAAKKTGDASELNALHEKLLNPPLPSGLL